MWALRPIVSTLKGFIGGASAHYFVGHAGEVWQCVEDSLALWRSEIKARRM